MKKLFAVIIFLAILTLMRCSRSVSAFTPPELTTKYSANAPTADGFMGSAEWNDTTKYAINLAGVTTTEAWLYIKHNETHIFVGLLVWEIQAHGFDEFVLAFDEGDDGSYGSGTRDFVLTPLQEDLKVCDSDHTLRDGYYNISFYADLDEIDFSADCAHETDHATTPSEIEYSEGLAFVDDHWEAEFAIPFVGLDGGTSDVSDLSCNVTDTIGIKIQYFFSPGANSFYYPEGDKLQVEQYANLSFPVPTIESCDSLGTRKDNFTLHEDVYINGSGFLPSTTYNVYVVDDTETWIDGMLIPARISGTTTSILSQSDGTLSPIVIWGNASIVGNYDIVIDVNGNGLYDADVDTLDNNDVALTAGFTVPELSSIVLLLCIVATLLTTTLSRKRHI